MSEATIQNRLWSREEYDRLIAEGMFHPEERLELIEGEIIQRSPQRSNHATAVTLVENALRTVFGKNYVVRVQMPLAISSDSEPEPDLAVVTGTPRDYRDEHPNTAELVVEIADTTLTYDRTKKTALYAQAGIQEYWILNLINRQLEVYRQPYAGQATTSSYKTHEVKTAAETIISLHGPQQSIAIANLLP
jgi:Uma2 family endonuclease